MVRSITKLKIPIMQDALMSNISTLHTTGIIVADTSKFAFVSSIPESMLRDVPPTSKVLESYHIIHASGFGPLTPEIQLIIAEAYKRKKGGNKGSKKVENKKGDNEGPSEPPNTPKKQKAKDLLLLQLLLKNKVEEGCSQDQEELIVRNEEEEPVLNEDVTSNPEVTPTYNDFFTSPPHSPKTTTSFALITIAPCSPPVSSQPQSTIPLSNPLFTNSIIPPTTSVEPPVSANTFDAGDNNSGFTTSHITPPISPLRQEDPDMIYRDGEDDLPGFTFSPFTIRTESDDKALITKGET
uniref:Uncharacterized protein n=1 Tax=Lactuca sativa TaxID=4236 RepID=A0A9R1W737_LACSA|nr:hypothetical protein LSAT_V11C300137390 [Lactuca sativa]